MITKLWILKSTNLNYDKNIRYKITNFIKYNYEN